MITTILTIQKEDRDTIEKVCAVADTQCRFFTNESNDQLLMVEFNESDPGIMYRIGAMVGLSKIEKYINKSL